MSQNIKPESQHDYLSSWEDALRFGLMGGRPFSEISITTYFYYAEWFYPLKISKKSCPVGIQIKVIEALHSYLAYRPKVKEEWLLINRNGNRMDRFGIRNRLNRLGERTKVKVTPHALRRAFVRFNVNKGRPLVMLQIACGHNDIATIRSYCMTTEDETIEAMQAWD
jgi:site-specific recombinase XerD